MVRASIALAIAFGFTLPAMADDLAKSAKAKAEEVSQAVLKEDYAKILDLTHPAVIEQTGGKEKMLETMKTGMKFLKDSGYSIQANKVLDPQEPVTEDGTTYVVVPNTIEIKTPMGTIVSKSYLLGISPDSGKSWTFIDGAGMKNPEAVKKVLPKLPSKVKLPEPQAPMLVKE